MDNKYVNAKLNKLTKFCWPVIIVGGGMAIHSIYSIIKSVPETPAVKVIHAQYDSIGKISGSAKAAVNNMVTANDAVKKLGYSPIVNVDSIDSYVSRLDSVIANAEREQFALHNTPEYKAYTAEVKKAGNNFSYEFGAGMGLMMLSFLTVAGASIYYMSKKNPE